MNLWSVEHFFNIFVITFGRVQQQTHLRDFRPLAEVDQLSSLTGLQNWKKKVQIHLFQSLAEDSSSQLLTIREWIMDRLLLIKT